MTLQSFIFPAALWLHWILAAAAMRLHVVHAEAGGAELGKMACLAALDSLVLQGVAREASQALQGVYVDPAHMTIEHLVDRRSVF